MGFDAGTQIGPDGKRVSIPDPDEMVPDPRGAPIMPVNDPISGTHIDHATGKRVPSTDGDLFAPEPTFPTFGRV